MLCFPDCKINLGLYVTERRADGYHNIETIFYPMPWEDVLEIVPAKETAIYLHGKNIAGNNNDNLVFKAYELLQEQFGNKIHPLDIHLLKNIPMGAGLGGGSADGAFMLRLLNEYFGLGLNNEQLAAFALNLGSDCPFFIYNTPQFAKGRGENMTSVQLDLSDYSIHIICPGIHVSTAAAFKTIIPKAAAFNLYTIADIAIDDWKHHIQNDFEGPVFQQHPEIGAIKSELYKQGAIYASMSGSGSAVYGIFKKGEKAEINDVYDTFYSL